jgi:hypothetical protein
MTRLEITWEKVRDERGKVIDDEYNFKTKYELVLEVGPSDIRADDNGECRILIGETNIDRGTDPIDEKGNVETPFRDGVHIQWDSERLKIPGFAVYDGRSTKVA